LTWLSSFDFNLAARRTTLELRETPYWSSTLVRRHALTPTSDQLSGGLDPAITYIPGTDFLNRYVRR
jgi:hypothetical protein